MEIFWGVVGVIAWVGWSFTRDRQWQKPILYWFVLVQICLVTAVLMVKSSKASEQPSAFVDCMVNKTKDIFPTMPDSVLPSLKLQAQITERNYAELAKAVNESPTVLADLVDPEINLGPLLTWQRNRRGEETSRCKDEQGQHHFEVNRFSQPTRSGLRVIEQKRH